MAYLMMFLSALGAATFLPLASEATLLFFLQQGYAPWVLGGVATAGNTVGALVNAALGRYALHYQHARWFPVSAGQLAQSQRWYARFGVWSLLLSWLPLVGDALTFVAGIMRTRWWLFVMLVMVAKGLRYAMVIGIFLAL